MGIPKWWQKAVFYQIYPRSFCDSNGDGMGDLPGILSKLDYLKHLGIDAIWLSPHYPSPMEDCGYDISDYEKVAPEYGTLGDFQKLIAEVHERNMYLVTDLVLNHTSDQHAWFIESRASRTNPKRDWYIWKKGVNDGPPNRWFSTFGGSAWEYDPATQEYYYHFFFKGQPDLNWRNPAVKEAMFKMAQYWLDLGVDGFRLDAIGTIYEDPAFPNQRAVFSLDDYYRMNRAARSKRAREALPAMFEELFSYQHDQPGIHELMKELRCAVDRYPGKVLIGETDDVSFYGKGDDELHMVFNFPLMQSARLNGKNIQENLVHRLEAVPEKAWLCNTLGNHDSPRMMNRFGDGQHDEAIARVNLVALLTIPGTPVLYNGEEIGMTDYLDIPVEKFRDPLGTRAYRLERELMARSEPQARRFACIEGRDKCRTPMQWDDQPNGGFCPETAVPWLPVNPNHSAGINVNEQLADDHSLLTFYTQVLSVRNQNRALQTGGIEFMATHHRDLFCFVREGDESRIFVGINFSDKKHQFYLPRSTRLCKPIFSGSVFLSPDNGRKLFFGRYGFVIAKI